jgi:hypothetical protein
MAHPQVLRFFAYSAERVLYSPEEDVRLRRFELLLHLEDGALEVLETAAPNSGLEGGKYLARRRWSLGSPLWWSEDESNVVFSLVGNCHIPVSTYRYTVGA